MYGMRFLKAGDLGQLVQAIRKVASSEKFVNSEMTARETP